MSDAAKFFQQLIEVLEGLKDDSGARGILAKTYTGVKTLKPFMTEDEGKQTKGFDSIQSSVEALRTEMMKGNWKEAASLLVYVLNYGRHIEHFVWRLGLYIIWNHRETVADHLKDFVKVAYSKTSLYHHEIRLIGFLLQINTGLYNEAKDLALKMPRASKGRRRFPTTYMEQIAKLLEGYKGALEYVRWMESLQNVKPNGRKHGEVAESVTIVFADKALQTLSSLFDSVSEAPHVFLAMYLQLLSAKEGDTVAKSYALKLSKARENDLAIQATVNAFLGQSREVLERMVISSPGDTCVFDLARILLQGDCSDDSGNEDDDATTSTDFNGNNAARALSLVANALDFTPNFTSVTGWSLFWQALKKVCTIGTTNCAKEVHSVYEDRKSWWNMVHFVDGVNSSPNLRLLKASCCYVLESEDHPYVRTALQNDAQKTLQTYIKQIKSRKHDLDAKRATCNETTPASQPPSLFYLDSESDAGTVVDETEWEALSESEMTLPKSAHNFQKSIPSFNDRRYRPNLKDFDVFTRLRKRLQLKKERKVAQETGITDAVSTVIFEEDVTLFGCAAQSPCTTDAENLPVPDIRVKKRIVRNRKKVTRTLVARSARRYERELVDSDSEPEIRPSEKNKSGLAASALATSPAKSPSPNLLALSSEPSISRRESELGSSSSTTSDNDEDNMSLSILSDRSSYRNLPRTPAQKRPRRDLAELLPADSNSNSDSKSSSVLVVSDLDITVHGRISNTSSRASLNDDASRTDVTGKGIDIYAFNSDDEKHSVPSSAKRKSVKASDVTLDQSFPASPDLFASQASVEDNYSQFKHVVPETEDLGAEEATELTLKITNIQSGLTQEEQKKVDEVVHSILRSRDKTSSPLLECEFTDEEGQDGKSAVKDWVSNLDILSFIEEEQENLETTIKEEPYDETSLNQGVQELDTDPNKADELTGGEVSLISTATPKKPEMSHKDEIVSPPETVKQQLFSKKSKRTQEKFPTKRRKLKDIPEVDVEPIVESNNRRLRLEMSEDDEPANSNSLQTASEAVTVQVKSKERNESTKTDRMTDALSSQEKASQEEVKKPVKKKKLLASRHHSVSDSILEEVTERNNEVQEKRAPEQSSFQAEKPEIPADETFLRPDSRQIFLKSKTKNQDRVRLYSEASSVASVQESSVTSGQDRLNESIDSSSSSIRKKKKKKKKKKQSIIAANSQICSSDSVNTMKENVPVISNVEQGSQVLPKKKKKKKKSKNKGGDSVGQEGNQGEKASHVVSEESSMSLAPSESQQAEPSKVKKKKKKKKKNNQVLVEVHEDAPNDLNTKKQEESSFEGDLEPLIPVSPPLQTEHPSPVSKEKHAAVVTEKNEGKKSKKKTETNDVATVETSGASEKTPGLVNFEANSVPPDATETGVEKDPISMNSESTERKKAKNEKQKAVEASKTSSVDVPEERDYSDSYIATFIKEFVAKPKTPKRTKGSVGQNASSVSSVTPTERFSESVSSTKQARRATATSKVNRQTELQSVSSIPLDGSLGLAPGNVNGTLPLPTNFDNEDPASGAPLKEKRKHRETESGIEGVAEDIVLAVKDKSTAKKRKEQSDINHNAEKTQNARVSDAESDEEDSAFVSMYIKSFLTNSGTPKQAKGANVKLAARKAPKRTASKPGNLSVVNPGGIGVRDNTAFTSQNIGNVSPTVSTSATLAMTSVEDNPEHLSSEALSPVKSSSPSASKKKGRSKERSSKVAVSTVGSGTEECIHSDRHEGKHNGNHVKGSQIKDQKASQQESNDKPGNPTTDKSGTSLQNEDDDSVDDDFVKKYLKDYFSGIKQTKVPQKDMKRRKQISVAEDSQVKQPTAKRAKVAASVTSDHTVSKSMAGKRHGDSCKKTDEEINVVRDQPVDIAAPSPTKRKIEGKNGGKRSRQKDTTDVLHTKVKKLVLPKDALSKLPTPPSKINVESGEENLVSKNSNSPKAHQDSIEESGIYSYSEQEASSKSVGPLKSSKKKSNRDKSDLMLGDAGKKTNVLETDDSDEIDLKKATDLVLQKCLARLRGKLTR